MFKRILVANRGEIAVRIIRACREMGIETVAVYSQADASALHIQLATRAVCIGPAAARDSYLNMNSLLTVALETGCDAVHPGFGFLSENSAFARLCAQCGLKFIGPSADVIDCMGNKAAARKLMRQHGIPVVPGSEGCIATLEEAVNFAEKAGYPVLVKASAGGGGKGMRKAFSKEELVACFDVAKAEAKACFGNDEMYIEKLIINPKHIEFQILADSHGTVLHLWERDCSLQRRNQKLLEEAPCKVLTPALRSEMGEVAVRAAKAAGYENAGTIEFILDAEGTYYFIEMNTRIQVEHPVTEMITGIDLIKEQICIAAGLKLGLTQEEVALNGHAIECRINAENPLQNFAPCPGTIEFLHLPQGFGVRVDTDLYTGCQTSPFYDSMIAKVIVHGATRLEAIRKMRRVLEELTIEGITTNQMLQYAFLFNKDFVKGEYDTGFLQENFDSVREFIASAQGEVQQ